MNQPNSFHVFYVLMASMVLGASTYETIVVHPAWSRQVPESLESFGRDPLSRLNLAAFWAPAAPIYALSAIVAVAMSFIDGTRNVRLIISAVCAVVVVAWTLTYFRPAIVRFTLRGGGSATGEKLVAEVNRWIVLNYVRVLLAAIAWAGALAAMIVPV